MEVRWIEWVRRLHAIVQNSLMFSKDPFDRERYEQVRSIAAEILASSTEMDPVLVHSLLQGEQGYATPKIDVRGAVFHENRLLFVRETADGLWTLPGGWADVGESPAEAVVREIPHSIAFSGHPRSLSSWSCAFNACLPWGLIRCRDLRTWG
jgi:hypothetical protein